MSKRQGRRPHRAFTPGRWGDTGNKCSSKSSPENKGGWCLPPILSSNPNPLRRAQLCPGEVLLTRRGLKELLHSGGTQDKLSTRLLRVTGHIINIKGFGNRGGKGNYFYKKGRKEKGRGCEWMENSLLRVMATRNRGQARAFPTPLGLP